MIPTQYMTHLAFIFNGITSYKYYTCVSYFKIKSVSSSFLDFSIIIFIASDIIKRDKSIQ